MRKWRLWLMSALLTPSYAQAQAESADLVLRGGLVHTVDGRRPRAQALAVRANRIVAVGTDAEIAGFVGPKTRVLELAGRTVVPGFVDAHAHLLGIGFLRLDVDLTEARSYDEVIARVAAAAKERGPGEWIRGRGWHEARWTSPPPGAVRGFPTHHALSARTPRNPVVLERADGHAVLANARAMALRGVARGTAAPAGGELVEDAAGEPTGIFVDNAQSLVLPPERSRADEALALARAMDECLQKGVTSLTDAGAELRVIELYRKALDEGRLRIRLSVMAAGMETMQALGRPDEGPSGFLTLRAAKLYADGALGSRGAALLAPYADDPGNVGLLVTPAERILEAARYALAHGFQLATHAIGDRANRMVLDVYERALAEAGPRGKDARFRIEHAQVLAPGDIPRFGRLGVLAAMQGVHCPSDRPWAEARLGKERLAGAYAWRKLLATGAVILNGTDAPVEDVSPLRNFHATVTRQDASGRPPGGFDPEEKLTRAEALRSLTLDAAYGSFAERERGSLEPGKLADLVVLSQDILSVPDDALLATEVVATIVDGRIAYLGPRSGLER